MDTTHRIYIAGLCGQLGWAPRTTLKELVAEMVQADYTSAKRDALVKLAGFQTFDHHE